MSSFLQSLMQRRRFGMQPGLENMHRLLTRLDHPEREIAAIHIAGTNGKGSVAALCDAVLNAAGYRCGRFTSPHLMTLNERFFVAGQMVDDALLTAAANEVEPHIRALERQTKCTITFFECLTAMAFVIFRATDTRLVVLESGLGGRYDATNVVTPLLSVITTIGLDHCDWLGATLAAIAAEKAGIIKASRPIVCGFMAFEAQMVIAQRAQALNAPLIDVATSVNVQVTRSNLRGQTLKIASWERNLPPLQLPLIGTYHAQNAATAVAALEVACNQGLNITPTAYQQGFSQVCWPGRLQLASTTPPIIVDGAHNPAAITALLQALKSCQPKTPLALIVGFCNDKATHEILHLLAPQVKCAWAVTIPSERALDAPTLAQQMRLAGVPHARPATDLTSAIKAASTWALEQRGAILICGSLYLVGPALQILKAFPWQSHRQDDNDLLNVSTTP